MPAGRDLFFHFNDSSSFPTASYVAIHFDSSIVIGSDTILYPYRIVNDDRDSLGYCLFTPYDTSWIGHQVIAEGSNATIFFNKYNDSVRINSTWPLNSSWKCVSLKNSAYIEATITAKVFSLVLDTTDTVKVITFQAKDSNNLNISHPINSKQIRVAKNFGLIQALNFHEFPDDTTIYDLRGISNPNRGLVNITARNIFDYDVGDEFHYYDLDRWGSPSYYIIKERYYILTVLSKTTSSNLDTIIYTYEKCEAIFIYDSDLGYDTTRFKTNITENIVLSELEFMNKLPFELVISTQVIYPHVGWSELIPDSLRTSKQFDLNYDYDSTKQCVFEPLISWFDWPTIYSKGLGLTHKRGEQDPIFNYWETNLRYYKKGNETSGNPLDCNKLLLRTTSAMPDESIKIFPNPASESVNILLPKSLIQRNGLLDFRLYDLMGRELLSSLMTQQLTNIQTETLATGLYFYEITSHQISIAKGKLVVQ
ncbi:MAG: T9SS type A sorting domain-containing protein [Bacteroidetes bacterium]|nr:T9SS type A sorting domain-containing protein [Bacteroidota bacterium]